MASIVRAVIGYPKGGLCRWGGEEREEKEKGREGKVLVRLDWSTHEEGVARGGHQKSREPSQGG